jgi:hypothetical protein
MTVGGDYRPFAMPWRNFLGRLVRVNGALWAVGQSGMLRRSGTDWKRVESLVVDQSMREPERAGAGKAAR